MIAPANLDDHWATWQPAKIGSGAKNGVDRNMQDLSLGESLEGKTKLKAITMESDFDKSARKIKLEMFKEIISFYHQETNSRMYNKRWEELHDPALVNISLEQRLEQGTKGKDAANEKYKEANWFGAMYTYALAFGCLIPYHLDSMTPGDPMRAKMAAFEAAIWSNVAACAITASTDNKLDESMKVGVIQLGIKAAKVCIDMQDMVTVGIIKKACGRASTLRDKLKPKDRQIGDEEAESWKKQVEMLKGEDDKMMFSKVPIDKKVIG